MKVKPEWLRLLGFHPINDSGSGSTQYGEGQTTGSPSPSFKYVSAVLWEKWASFLRGELTIGYQAIPLPSIKASPVQNLASSGVEHSMARGSQEVIVVTSGYQEKLETGRRAPWCQTLVVLDTGYLWIQKRSSLKPSSSRPAYTISGEGGEGEGREAEREETQMKTKRKQK